MPFKKGTSDKTTESNFHEMRHGKTYAKVRRKHGKKKAHQMLIAAVLENRRRSKLKKATESGPINQAQMRPEEFEVYYPEDLVSLDQELLGE